MFDHIRWWYIQRYIDEPAHSQRWLAAIARVGVEMGDWPEER